MIFTKVQIRETDFHISTGRLHAKWERDHVFEFNERQPTIRVFENQKLAREYHIETLDENPDLRGQYFHTSIRITRSGAVMIDGILSPDRVKVPDNEKMSYEGIRLHPFYLSKNEQKNEERKGTGLFRRGLHFSGTITGGNVRLVCICDSCRKSFTVTSFHAGVSEAQYFYSVDSKQTLFVPYHFIKNMPTQLQKSIDDEVLKEVEQKLPKPSSGSGEYKYYNPFRLPHCSAAFIDFEKNKEIRVNEYYGIRLINQSLEHFTETK